ncbi:alpha/beta hydrolase fold domain-containing protein [Oceanisphaera sp. W20_SRM_FM3]|uniref:alpha/beta hydrolase fold domain-containing protein n=1 Tax=Oceanisphaera sp. W20_SRM_FM3 TaxID=3240267 RepID=UPI003F9AD18B
MAVTSCTSYQQNDSYSQGFRHAYNVNNGNSVDFTVIKDINYSITDWPQSLAADFYLPKILSPEKNNWPVVLMVHGGGWSGRDRSDMDSTSKKLAKKGYAVFNVSYRFTPEFIYPAPVQDLQLALLWLQNNAKKYQLDLERVNAWGYSSGSHLVTQLASVKPGEAQTLDFSPPLPKIRAVVAGGIPADLSQYSNSPIVVPFLGVKRDENPQLYKEASPITHVSSDDPPVFLYHGKLDQLVEKEQSINYYHALRKAGVPAELYLHPLWGHFAMFLFGWDAEHKAIDFLNQYNY